MVRGTLEVLRIVNIPYILYDDTRHCQLDVMVTNNKHGTKNYNYKQNLLLCNNRRAYHIRQIKIPDTRILIRKKYQR